MRMDRIALSLATSIACVIAAQASAFSEENRGTYEQQMACTPDVWRLCFDQIPHVNRITSCLRQNTSQLSGACRSVVDSNARVPQPTPPQPRRPEVHPLTYNP